MKITLVTDSAIEPLLKDTVKDHLRLVRGYTDEDDLLDNLIKASRGWAENYTGRAFINQTWRFYLDEFPWDNYIELPKGTLQSVTHLKYTDSGETQSTFSSSDYTVDTASEPGRIVLDYGQSWPSVNLWPTNPIEIEYVAGYGSARTNIPMQIRQAMLLLIGHWYENREAFLATRQTGQIAAVPLTLQSMLYSYRMWSF